MQSRTIQKILSEAYHSSWKSQLNKHAEIFHNPSRSEIQKIGKEIRFYAVADSKDLYVWNADVVLHGEVMNKLHLPNPFDSADILPGEATRKGSRYEMEFSALLDTLYHNRDQESNDILRDVLAYDWSWIEAYGIKVESYLKLFREER